MLHYENGNFELNEKADASEAADRILEVLHEWTVKRRH